MRKFLFSMVIILFLFSFLILYHNNKFPHTAWVKEVIDGDTVQLENGLLLRYLGVNSPEIKEKNSGEWMEKISYWGKQAYLYNKELVENRRIRIEYDRRKKDKYGRLLGYIFVNGKFVNMILLKKGLAVIDVRSPNFNYVELLAEAFKEARMRRKGIWSDSRSLNPKEVQKLVGEIVVLEGEVLDVYEGENIILIFMPGNFRVVVFKDNLRLFSKTKLMNLKGRKIRLYGMVKKYKGHNEMVIHHPCQLEVLK